MAQRTIDHFYASYEEAVQVVADLTAEGVSADDINLIDSVTDPRLPPEVTEDTAQNPAGTGATLGTVIGGGIGALIGVGAIAVPYTDPLVQAGWIVPTLLFAGVGAAIGAVLGMVTRVGVTNRRAHSIAEGLDRGKHLVVVRVDERYAEQIQAVMARPHVVHAGREPVYDMEPVLDTRSPDQVEADIHRRERTIDYKSE